MSDDPRLSTSPARALGLVLAAAMSLDRETCAQLDLWKDDPTFPYRDQARIILELRRSLDATAASLQERPPLDDGTPWCKACESWHARPKSRGHWMALQCFAPYEEGLTQPAKDGPEVRYGETTAGEPFIQIGASKIVNPTEEDLEEAREIEMGGHNAS